MLEKCNKSKREAQYKNNLDQCSQVQIYFTSFTLQMGSIVFVFVLMEINKWNNSTEINYENQIRVCKTYLFFLLFFRTGNLTKIKRRRKKTTKKHKLNHKIIVKCFV